MWLNLDKKLKPNLFFFSFFISNEKFIKLSKKKGHPSIQEVYIWGEIQSNKQITSIHQSWNQILPVDIRLRL